MYKFGISLVLDKFLTLKNANIFVFSSLNRNFALPLQPNEQTEQKNWYSMVAVIDVPIDTVAVGVAPSRDGDQRNYRLRGLYPPCAPRALCSICRPSGRLPALSVPTFRLYGSSHDYAGATGYLKAEPTLLPE